MKPIKGIEGLVTPTQQAEKKTAAAPAQEAKDKKDYKTVSYSITPLLDEQMRYIAFYDRRKINEVVEEAFRAYVAKWKPAEQFEANLPR